MSENIAAPESMNAHNGISKETLLFGLIAESAQTNRLFVVLNRLIKSEGSDAMIIPMNIREDDFYFTLANMKKSHVNGAYIASEYQESAVELLDERSELVRVSKLCDFALREGERLYGDYIYPKAIAKSVADAKSVAIIGANGLAGALALELASKSPSFYAQSVEALMALSQELNSQIDINRIASDMAIDLSGYDVVIVCEDTTLHSDTLRTIKHRVDTDDTTRFFDAMSEIIYNNYIAKG